MAESSDSCSQEKKKNSLFLKRVRRCSRRTDSDGAATGPDSQGAEPVVGIQIGVAKVFVGVAMETVGAALEEI